MNLKTVSNNFYEPHEGKNISDTIGSIAKRAHTRGLQKRNIGVSTVSDVVSLIRDHIQPETEKFKKFIIEEVEPCQRPTKNEKKVGISLAGISKCLLAGNQLYEL